MKSIHNIKCRKGFSLLMPAMLLLVLSCQNMDDILNSTDTQNINSVSASSAHFSESSDISISILKGLTNAQYSGAPLSSDIVPNLSKIDSRLTCADILISRTGTVNSPSGTITIHFDSTCVDSSGVKRRGKIIINYVGKRWAVGSTVSIQLQNFYRNYTRIEGVLSDTISLITTVGPDTTQITFSSFLKNGIITFGDGKRCDSMFYNLKRTWYRSIIRINNKWQITGAVVGKPPQSNGINKNGNHYYLKEITSPLVYRFVCLHNKVFIPVEGVETITIGGKNYTIDFGQGTCDNLITVDNQTINVTQDGN